MTEYVIQIQTSPNGQYIGWLAKSFEVTDTDLIPPPDKVPSDREQTVMTNTVSYNAIVAAYDEYHPDSIFAKNGTNIDVSGAVTDSWPID